MDELAPLIAEYLPTAQSVQFAAELAPSTSEYLPAAQARHLLIESAPSWVEYLPSAQFKHCWAPGISLYLPASHAEHTRLPSSIPELYPALHLHATLPAEEPESDGQSLQSESFVDPSVVENLPSGHAKHAVALSTSVHFPASQGRQTAFPAAAL